MLLFLMVWSGFDFEVGGPAAKRKWKMVPIVVNVVNCCCRNKVKMNFF